jgi:hypothetical protein
LETDRVPHGKERKQGARVDREGTIRVTRRSEARCEAKSEYGARSVLRAPRPEQEQA